MSIGKCIIFSAPSGSGKTTLVKYLLGQNELNLIFSISATTRKKRNNEKNKVDYIFLDKDSFKNKIGNEEFLEFEEVYEGVFYGTLKESVRTLLNKYNVIFDIDVEGGLKLKNQFNEKALAVFVRPPSIQELQKRLNKRNNDSSESINTRLSKAKLELSREEFFDKTIVNDDLSDSKKEAYNLVSEFLNKK
ncbi:guanylate kinase [Flavobacteriaceae bacterium]|jgi:guanylate kinase|nr:guanylate kinase [Flavobacteriaceae bacterium]